MPSSEYKEPRVCACGYTTKRMSCWSTHKKSCKSIPNEKEVRIAALEAQLVVKDQQLATKDEQLIKKDEQIKEKDEQLIKRDEQIKELRQNAKDEVKQPRKKSKKSNKEDIKRVYRSEPERRKIAESQNWKCAGVTCKLPGKKLEAYDLHHIIPLWKNGPDTNDNLQAVCPACHRILTDQEHVERMNLFDEFLRSRCHLVQ